MVIERWEIMGNHGKSWEIVITSTRHAGETRAVGKDRLGSRSRSRLRLGPGVRISEGTGTGKDRLGARLRSARRGHPRGCFCRNIVTNRINIGSFRCFCRNIGRNKPRRSRNKGLLCGLLGIVAISKSLRGSEHDVAWL